MDRTSLTVAASAFKNPWPSDCLHMVIASSAAESRVVVGAAAWWLPPARPHDPTSTPMITASRVGLILLGTILVMAPRHLCVAGTRSVCVDPDCPLMTRVMSSESSAKGVMASMVRMFATGDVTQADAVVSPDYVDYQGLGSGPIYGADGFRRVVAVARGGFADLDTSILDCIAEGEAGRGPHRVVWHATIGRGGTSPDDRHPPSDGWTSRRALGRSLLIRAPSAEVPYPDGCPSRRIAWLGALPLQKRHSGARGRQRRSQAGER
jgi:hypothetical protein